MLNVLDLQDLFISSERILKICCLRSDSEDFPGKTRGISEVIPKLDDSSKLEHHSCFPYHSSVVNVLAVAPCFGTESVLGTR